MLSKVPHDVEKLSESMDKFTDGVDRLSLGYDMSCIILNLFDPGLGVRLSGKV